MELRRQLRWLTASGFLSMMAWNVWQSRRLKLPVGKSTAAEAPLSPLPLLLPPPHVPLPPPWSEPPPEERILPISFGLPDGRWDRVRKARPRSPPIPPSSDHNVIIPTTLTHHGINSKTRDFSIIVPGILRTYIYQTEDAYYDGYGEAYFGMTSKKGGWDSFRHYEIIAGGGIPYFLDLDGLPPRTMHTFPRDLIHTAMTLPGVPNTTQVAMFLQHYKQSMSESLLNIDHSLFNRTRYDELRDQLVEHALQHMTWTAVADYLWTTVQRTYPMCFLLPTHGDPNSTATTNDATTNTTRQPLRVLFVTTPGCEYMSCTVWGGTYEWLGRPRNDKSDTGHTMASLFGPKFQIFSDLHAPSKQGDYGRGFSYSNVFDNWSSAQGANTDQESFQLMIDPILQHRLDTGYFNVIVHMNGGNRFCKLSEFLPPPTPVVVAPKPTTTLTSTDTTTDNRTTKTFLHEYQEKYDPLVIVIDGSDEDGCHVFSPDDGLQYHMHFIREYDAARRVMGPNDRPRSWTGCAATAVADQPP
jgi:hypothetical protein